jgi:cellulose synthase/poly-beta-1,6-N-acetylglucosamine synthase-like glycosyltransferase/peptidoglycan/xylan/chitin deacetylase (PgdA/CDA1 family)
VLLSAVLLLGFVSVLLVEAYVNARFVPDSRYEEGDDDQVPPAIKRGGPIIDTSQDRVRSYSLPSHTIALTFDDGPDPTWTPQILAVLRKHHVHATFFVIGSQVVKNPALARELVRDGHELGVHTFTHPEVAGLPAWRRKLEYDQTQLALAGATGVTSSLVRFPYSSEAAALDNTYWPIVEEAGNLGYLTVLSDVDSEDWSRPGVSEIVRNATPSAGAGAVVLMHDAGGNRAETIAALEKYLPLMQRAGYRFTTVSTGMDAALTAGRTSSPATRPMFAGNSPAHGGVLWRGRALVGVVQIAGGLLMLLAVLLIVAGGLFVLRAVLLFGGAGLHVRRHRRPPPGPSVDEAVSVVVPAYNERAGIAAAVRSIALGDHPGIDVIVVDDGSTDGTADIVRSLGLPNVRVVSVQNGGKASALNVGVALASHDLIVMVDGDTVFEPDSIHRLVQPFADPAVGAVAGNVKVGNRQRIVARWQHIEYVIGFNLDRRLYDLLQIMPTVPGAIGAFRRAALIEVGGPSDDTLAEDTDLTMALVRAGWRVVYEEKARAWTEAPATVRELWAQRYRWSYGTMQAMWKHRRAFVERGSSGRFGRIGLPMLVLFQVLLPALAPLIDILLLYGLLFENRLECVVAWGAMLALQLVTAVIAFRMDGEGLRPLLLLPLQQFVYRQLMYLVLLRSAATALAGVRLRWQKLRRVGGVSVPAR